MYYVSSIQIIVILEKITAEKLRLDDLEQLSDDKTLQEDKQKFFEKAFQSDLENYKKLGSAALGINIFENYSNCVY